MRSMKKRRAKKGEAGASGPKRSAASFNRINVKSDKIADFRYDSKPGVLLKDSTPSPSRADMALKDLVRGNVFKSNPTTVKQTNSNKRRYA